MVVGEVAQFPGTNREHKAKLWRKAMTEKRSRGEASSRFPGFRGPVPRPDGVSGDPTGVPKPDLTAVCQSSVDGAGCAAAAGFGMTAIAVDRILLSDGKRRGVTRLFPVVIVPSSLRLHRRV